MHGVLGGVWFKGITMYVRGVFRGAYKYTVSIIYVILNFNDFNSLIVILFSLSEYVA